MQAEEPIRLPSGCHPEDTGHCEIPTNLGATIFQRKRLGGRVSPCLACFARPLSLFSCFLRRAQGEHPYLRLCLRYIYIEISVYICIYTVHHLRHHAKVTLSHFEAVLDSFYFIGNSMKDVLNLYTKVAGRPMLPPLWGLFLGDSDCYNNARHKMTTSTALLLGVRRLSLATIHEIKSVRH